MPKELILTGTGFFCIILSFLILITSDKIAVQLATMMLCGLCFFQTRLLYNAHQAAAKHDLLSSTLDTVVDMHWYWDLENGTFEYRGALPDLLGYPLSANPDSTFWSHVIHPVDRPLQKYQLLRHLEDESRPYHCEYRMRDHDGNYHWFLGRGKVVKRSKHGRAQLMVGSLEHIQERKELEQSLIHAHKMEAVGQLTGGIAHDFNNLLGIIIGNLELLELSQYEDANVLNRIRSAFKAATRGAEITRRLLRFTNDNVRVNRRIVVNDIISEFELLISKSLTSAISMELKLTDDVWPVDVDPGNFSDSILNMTLNARDAMPQGGHLIIETANKTFDADYVKYNSGATVGDFVMISIGDTGMGMSAEVKARILEPFFTTKKEGKGTGLGMSMVNSFVKQSGGHMNIYSESSVGSTFSIYLARADVGEAAKTTDAKASSELPRGDETVLLVDDETALLEVGVTRLNILAERTDIDIVFTSCCKYKSNYKTNY